MLDLLSSEVAADVEHRLNIATPSECRRRKCSVPINVKLEVVYEVVAGLMSPERAERELYLRMGPRCPNFIIKNTMEHG
jgi:hypothetical protein